MQTTDKLMEYIQDSPSPYHAAAAAAARLEAAGFTRLEESAPGALSSGQCCYTTRNQSSLIAFRLPGGTPEGWRMTAAHSDSPTFYVKNDALEGDKRYVRLAVEGYGGMNCASWLDRPLTVAGRAVVRTPAGVEGRLVYLDRDLLTIPSLAIHQQRDVNRGHDYNAQKDMQPLYALGGGPSLTALLAEELGVDVGDILATGYWAAQISQISPEDTVLVLGAGPTGLCTLQCVLLENPRRVIVCERDPQRLAFVRAHYPQVLALEPEGLREAVLAHSAHGGADVVLEVAGSEDTFRLAWECARPNAVVTVVALYDRPQLLPLPEMYGKNLTFKTGGVDGCDSQEILDLIAAGKLDTTPLITHTVPLRDIAAAYDLFEHRRDGVIKVAVDCSMA